MADVRLKLKVDDAELVQAERRIVKLNATSARRLQTEEHYKNHFGPQSPLSTPEQQKKLAAFMSRELPQAAKQSETAIQAVQTATGGASMAMNALSIAGAAVAGVLAAAAVAIVAVAAALVLAGKAAFDATKNFADYAIEIGNLAESTGLATETISALKHEAEAQGRSFGVVESAAASFRKQIGEASAGSVEAKNNLKALGVDGQKAMFDVDGAFKQAVASIMKAPEGVEQSRLAFAAFGDEGYKLLPFLKEFGGDVDAAIAKAESLGIVVGQDNVAAARAFNRHYEDAKKVIQGITYTFGNEFLPVVSSVLERFSSYLIENRSNIQKLSAATGLMVEDAIRGFNVLKQWVSDNAYVFGFLEYLPAVALARSIGNSYGTRVASKPQEAAAMAVGGVEDPGALNARFGYKPPKAKKTPETEAEKQAKFLAQLLGDLNRELEYFGDKSKVAAVSQQILARGISLANAEAVRALGIAKQLDERQKEADAKKKRDEELKEYKELLAKTTAEIDASAVKDRLAIGANIKELEQQIALGRELNIVEKARIDLQTQLAEAEAIGFSKLLPDKEGLIAKMRVEGEETIKRLETELSLRTRVADIEKRKQLDKERDESFKEFSQSLQDQLETVQRLGEPLSVYEQTLREITRSQHKYTEQQKTELLNYSAQIDALRELNRQHAELKAFFEEGLRYAFEGDFKGLFENWGDRIKDNLADKLSDIFATHFLGYDPKKTNNPVARPIVDKLDETNNILRTIAFGGGGAGAAAGAGGGGGIFSRILGAFGIGGGSGPGGTPNFNPNAGSSSGGALSNGDVMNWVTGGSLGGGSGSSGGSLLGQLSQLFSTGAGGIFAPQKNLLNGKMSGAAGIMSGIGQLATIAGGLIGGRVGGVLSMAGTGASIGAMFGPWGAAIGAGIGALIGLFTGGGQRRRDEQTRNQGMLDAQAAIKSQFDALATQVRFGQIDPASAIIRGTAIGDQVRSQYLQMANSLQDKKTRRIAVADVSRVDTLIAQRMAELRGLTEIAQGSADRMKRILPEFAGGHYFADYFRPNGLLPGMFDGSDNILAMISRGEMVLNPAQINKVKRQAGFDVFAGAGIPNYPKANPSSHLATGGIVGGMGLAASAPQILMQPNLTVVVEGATFDAKTRAYLISDEGSKTFVNIYKKKKESGDIR